MTIAEFAENNKHCSGIIYLSDDAEVYYDLLSRPSDDNINHAQVTLIDECDQLDMNGCQFYLWLNTEDPDAWKNYMDLEEDTKISIRNNAAKEYGYSESDRFVVFTEKGE